MNSKVQDNINKIEINEEVNIIFLAIWPFDDIEINIDGSNLDEDADIYFVR